MRHKLTRAAAACAAVAAIALNAAPASAAAYDYTNPQNDGCANTAGPANGAASTVPIYDPEISGDVLGWVDLRWSTACHTNWSRVRMNPNASFAATGAGILVWATRPSDGANTWGHDGDPGPYGGTSNFSDQLYGNNVTVCAWGELAYRSVNGPTSWATAHYCF